MPGEAYCNECGAELATASAPADEGTPDRVQPYMGSTEGNGEGGLSVGVPVTEDTMTPEAMAQPPDISQAEAAQATPMPGVTSIETEAQAGVAPTMPTEEAAPVPTAPERAAS